MKGMLPTLGLYALVICLSQESRKQMIMKNYVALAMITPAVNNLFFNVIPPGLTKNRKKLNDSKALRISHDHNRFVDIYSRVTVDLDHLELGQRLREKAFLYARGTLNCVINLFVLAVINFTRTLNNYFAPLLVLGLQYIGYRQQFHIHFGEELVQDH